MMKRFVLMGLLVLGFGVVGCGVKGVRSSLSVAACEERLSWIKRGQDFGEMEKDWEGREVMQVTVDESRAGGIGERARKEGQGVSELREHMKKIRLKEPRWEVSPLVGEGDVERGDFVFRVYWWERRTKRPRRLLYEDRYRVDVKLREDEMGTVVYLDVALRNGLWSRMGGVSGERKEWVYEEFAKFLELEVE